MANIIQINGKKLKDTSAARMSSLAPVESSATASAAHAVGDYFWLNGTLYEATAAIAIGNIITVGANCEVAYLGSEVSNLKTHFDDLLDVETVYSKNLNKTPFDASITKKDVTFTRNSNYTISMSGNPSGEISYNWPPVIDDKWLLPAGEYTLSGGHRYMSVTLDLYTNKSDTSIAKQYSSGTDAKPFTTSTDYWAWIHFDIQSTASTDGVTMSPQVESGSRATEYQSPYYTETHSEVLDNLTANVSEHDTEITQLQEATDGLTVYETGKNLVDPVKLVTGFIDSDGSILTNGSYGNYKTSDYIALDASADYAFASYNASTGNIRTQQRVVCLLFNDSKEPIANTYQNVSSVGYLTFNSGATAKYARVSTTYDSAFQLEKAAMPSGYEVYAGGYVMGMSLGHKPLAQSQMGNVLFGKKWAVCGDSFTDGATDTIITDDGPYKGKRYVYPYLIANRNRMDVVRFFEGGRTLAFPAEPGTFVNSLTYPSGAYYYQNIPSDVDYITIYLGINDSNHATGTSQDGEDTTGVIPLGEISDNTTATYYGAWNVVLTWLITNRPNAHIGIIVTNGIAGNDNYRQAQIAIAEKYGIPYIDLNGDARTPAMIRTSNPNIASAVKTALIEKWRVSSDNTHPNDAAHLFESTFIEAFLRSI